MKNQYVINLLGGAGVGKSTYMFQLAGYFKSHGYPCECAAEWIKDAVYDGSKWAFQDQLFTYANQRKVLLSRLADKRVKIVVTDSPIILSAVYKPAPDPLFDQMIFRDFNKMNNINILLSRVDTTRFKPFGRVHGLERSLKIDNEILAYLLANKIDFMQISNTVELDRLLCLILEEIDKRENAE